MTRKIDVTDSGPIEGTFSIDLSHGPGVYEFRGARGTGKTTCISSIDWLAGHKVDITLHDGALSGKIEGFGVVAPIGGRKRRKGECEMDTIDAEKFSMTDILDPQGKTPEVRDATRIKALAVLSGVKADPTLYYELVGGQAAFDALELTLTDDPVVLATRIKTAFDKLARERQNTAAAEAKYAAPLEHVPEGLDISQSCDLDSLGAARDEARDIRQRFNDEREAGQKMERDISHAKAKLEGLEKEYSGPTVEAAESEVRASEVKFGEAENQVRNLEEQLTAAKNASAKAEDEKKIATLRLSTAQQHAEAISALDEIASRTANYPGEDDLHETHEAVEKASTAYNQGVRIRDVKQNHEKAKAHRDAANMAEKSALAARNKASEVFDVLAQSLHTKHLEIRSVDGNPRLFANHPKRGKTAFDRINGLSDGERVDFTLLELLPHIQAPGLLPIPQRVWQDLQPADRKRLHEVAIDKKLYLFGAQVDDGDLRVVYAGE